MRSLFEIVICICSVAGWMSASHLATLLVRERIISAFDMTKIGTGTSLIVMTSFFFVPPRSQIDAWLRLQLPISLSLAGAFLLAKMRNSAFENQMEKWISNLIMRMRRGYSLVGALEEEARKNTSANRIRMLAIARAVTFSPQKSGNQMPKQLKKEVLTRRDREIAKEFCRINSCASHQIAELDRWRLLIREKRIFRRRSVQAMAQVRAQSMLLSLVFAAISIFSTFAFGWSSVRGAFEIAFPMFLIGSFWIWRGGRRVKWTI